VRRPRLRPRTWYDLPLLALGTVWFLCSAWLYGLTKYCDAPVIPELNLGVALMGLWLGWLRRLEGGIVRAPEQSVAPPDPGISARAAHPSAQAPRVPNQGNPE
jgi:hypothetical protein